MSKLKNLEFNFESEFKLYVDNQKVRMYQIPVYKVMLVKESTQMYSKKQVKRPYDIYELAAQYLGGLDREHFVIIMLNTPNQIIGINTVSIGNLNSVPVHPREIFKPAIVAGAAGIILVHNHPSGIAQPSQDDIVLTQRLVSVGELIGIPVVDHIILGDNTYISLKEGGMI